MKLSQKRTCEGCRASTPRYQTTCELGFNHKGELIKNLGVHRMVPQEPCYKPKTITELYQAYELVRITRRQKTTEEQNADN